jgi:hypothetical protein
MEIKQLFGIAVIVNMTLAFANPVRAEWLTGSGLISQSQDTTITGFAITEYDLEDIESGSIKYYYTTKSEGKDITGEMIVRNMGGTSGVFTDISTDQSQGCYGRFEIENISSRKFNVTWHIDGKVGNRYCPMAGKSVTLKNMIFGQFTRWVN